MLIPLGALQYPATVCIQDNKFNKSTKVNDYLNGPLRGRDVISLSKFKKVLSLERNVGRELKLRISRRNEFDNVDPASVKLRRR